VSDSDFPADLQTLEPNYEIVRELGQGGMAAVYLGRRRDNGKLVAIKAIRARYLDDPDALQRFAREARMVTELSHPNIVATEAIEEIGDRAVAIIMQYVPGGTVRDRLREYGAFPAEYAESVLRDVANALGYAHGRGIVHRDVKPENVFLDSTSGRALLSDFGLARRIEGDVPITMLGASLGTPQYMSPEQIDGAQVDGRTDIYSLGVLGWELLTGKRPWAGENLYGMIYKQKHEELPRITSLRPRVPANLLFAIEGALMKDRERRWQTTDEFLEHLTYNPPPVLAVPHAGPTRRPADEPTVKFRRPSSSPPTVPNAGDRPQAWRTPRPVAATPAPRGDESSPRVSAHNPRRGALRLLALLAPFAIACVAGYVLFGDRIRLFARHDAAGEVASSSDSAATGSIRSRPTADTARRTAQPRPVPGNMNTPTTPAPSPRAGNTRVSRAPKTSIAKRSSLPDTTASTGRSGRCSEPTLSDQRACLMAIIAVNDRKLQQSYDSLVVELRRIARVRRGTPDPPRVASLRVEQRNWIAQRDRTCMGRQPAASGALWAQPVSECFKQLSASRAAELEERLRRARDDAR